MMYLSEVHKSDYVLAIELDDNFLPYLRSVLAKLEESKLDFESALINFDSSKARLIEKGFYPYEDRKIHEINNGEDPLSYYGFHIDKHYFPTEDYWGEYQPEKVFLNIYGGFIGFVFEVKTKKIDGIATLMSAWESMLK